MEQGEIMTYMRRENESGLPKSIRVSTTYDPIKYGGAWGTIVFHQKKIDPDDLGHRHPILNEFYTQKINPKEIHGTMVRYYQYAGYEIVQHSDSYVDELGNRIQEEIPGASLVGITTQKECDYLKFARYRYLREKGKNLTQITL